MNKQEYLNFMFKFAADKPAAVAINDSNLDAAQQNSSGTAVTPVGDPTTNTRLKTTGTAYPAGRIDNEVKYKQTAYPQYGSPRGLRHNRRRNMNLLHAYHGKNPEKTYTFMNKLLNWTDKAQAQAAATAIFPGWKNESSIFPEGVPVDEKMFKARNISQAQQLARRIGKNNETAVNILTPFFQKRGWDYWNGARHAGLQRSKQDPKTGKWYIPTVDMYSAGEPSRGAWGQTASYDDKGKMISPPPGLTWDQVRQAQVLSTQMGTNRRYSPFLSWLYR